MLHAGVEDVRLLDGGFQAWETAAYPVLARTPLAHPAVASAAGTRSWFFVGQSHEELVQMACNQVGNRDAVIARTEALTTAC